MAAEPPETTLDGTLERVVFAVTGSLEGIEASTY